MNSTSHRFQISSMANRMDTCHTKTEAAVTTISMESKLLQRVISVKITVFIYLVSLYCCHVIPHNYALYIITVPLNSKIM